MNKSYFIYKDFERVDNMTDYDRKRYKRIIDKIVSFPYSFQDLLEEFDDEDAEFLRYYYVADYFNIIDAKDKSEVFQLVIRDLLIKELSFTQPLWKGYRDILYNFVKEFD